MRTILALLALLLWTAPAVEAADAPPEQRVVIIHHPGPAWDKTKSFREQAGVQDHIAHYAEMLKDGTLAMGGPFLDDAGGMMISVPGADLKALQDFAAADPAVKSGLLTAEVHPWMVALKPDAK